jgi:hypothetical protein
MERGSVQSATESMPCRRIYRCDMQYVYYTSLMGGSRGALLRVYSEWAGSFSWKCLHCVQVFTYHSGQNKKRGDELHRPRSVTLNLYRPTSKAVSCLLVIRVYASYACSKKCIDRTKRSNGRCLEADFVGHSKNCHESRKVRKSIRPNNLHRFVCFGWATIEIIRNAAYVTLLNV